MPRSIVSSGKPPPSMPVGKMTRTSCASRLMCLVDFGRWCVVVALDERCYAGQYSHQQPVRGDAPCRLDDELGSPDRDTILIAVAEVRHVEHDRLCGGEVVGVLVDLDVFRSNCHRGLRT